MSARLRLAAVLLCALVLPRQATAEGAAPSTVLTTATPHLRWSDPLVGRLIERGIARSPTFARLVAALERSSVIVYVDMDLHERDAPAGALHFMSSAGSLRFVRIRLYPKTTSWMAILGNEAAFVGTLGHELQHAREVAEHASVHDEASLAAMLRTVGFAVRSRSGTHAFETEQAREIGIRVEREIRMGREAATAVADEEL